jgi:hypothetical protein
MKGALKAVGLDELFGAALRTIGKIRYCHCYAGIHYRRLPFAFKLSRTYLMFAQIPPEGTKRYRYVIAFAFHSL